jgi:aldose sugar dehydrogenase
MSCHGTGMACRMILECGLLGIALHPELPANPGVYLYWTCRSTAPPVDPFHPDEQQCLDTLMFAPDTDDIARKEFRPCDP